MDEIRIEPHGDKVRINYNGLLSKSGADQVYLHAGMGDSWRNEKDIPMRYEDGSWTTEMEIKDADNFHFCFKDSANNWDNNNGTNWSYEFPS